MLPALSHRPSAMKPEIRCQTSAQDQRSALTRKFFTDNLAHHLCRQGLVRQTEIGIQRIVDESLVPLSSSLGLSLEAFQDRIIEINRNARLPSLVNHCSAFAFGEIILLLHMSFFPSVSAYEPK